MSDRDALLHAIAARPEEDTPRLMYADWLEENGEPERADFVRTQVLVAQPGRTNEEQFQLVRKNVAYMKVWTRQWKNQLPRVSGIEWGDFNRGLIEEVQAADERPLLAHAAEIFAVPGVHVLRLTRLIGGLALADRPELARLRALRMVSARAAAPHLRTLLASAHLRNLKVLDLHGNAADDGVAEALADGRFPHLAELWLGGERGPRRRRGGAGPLPAPERADGTRPARQPAHRGRRAGRAPGAVPHRGKAVAGAVTSSRRSTAARPCRAGTARRRRPPGAATRASWCGPAA